MAQVRYLKNRPHSRHERIGIWLRAYDPVDGSSTGPGPPIVGFDSKMSSHRKFLASVDDELAGIRFKAEGAMKHCRLISLAAMLCTAVLMPSSVSSAMERIDIDLTQ
jgi:hypothetical protein